MNNLDMMRQTETGGIERNIVDRYANVNYTGLQLSEIEAIRERFKSNPVPVSNLVTRAEEDFSSLILGLQVTPDDPTLGFDNRNLKIKKSLKM